MLTIGCHLSSAKGYEAMAKDAEKIKANTFQFFTRNPRGGKAKAIDHKDIERFLSKASDLGIHQILAHAPYTLNPCSPDEKVREFVLYTPPGSGPESLPPRRRDMGRVSVYRVALNSSTSRAQVLAPTTPSILSPKAAWKPSTALRVVGPKRPSTAGAG